MKKIDLHKKRLENFDKKTTNISKWENYLNDICVVEYNSITPIIDFWSQNLSDALIDIVEAIEAQMQSTKSKSDKYFLFVKKAHYKYCYFKKTLNPLYDFRDTEKLIELDDMRMLLEIAMCEKQDSLMSWNLLIEHIELTLKMNKSLTMMATNGEKMSIQDSNKKHDEQIVLMREYINVLECKLGSLKKALKSEKDEYKIADLKIQMFELKVDIDAKKYYVNRYDKTRRAKI